MNAKKAIGVSLIGLGLYRMYKANQAIADVKNISSGDNQNGDFWKLDVCQNATSPFDGVTQTYSGTLIVTASFMWHSNERDHWNLNFTGTAGTNTNVKLLVWEKSRGTYTIFGEQTYSGGQDAVSCCYSFAQNIAANGHGDFIEITNGVNIHWKFNTNYYENSFTHPVLVVIKQV